MRGRLKMFYRITYKEKNYLGDSFDSHVRFLFYRQMRERTSQKLKNQANVPATAINIRFLVIHYFRKLVTVVTANTNIGINKNSNEKF